MSSANENIRCTLRESTLYRTSGNLSYKYVFHRERYFMLSENETYRGSCR